MVTFRRGRYRAAAVASSTADEPKEKCRLPILSPISTLPLSMKRLVFLITTAFVCAAILPGTSYAQMETAESTFKIGPRITLDVGDISDAYDGTFALGADARYRPVGIPLGGTAAFDYYFAADEFTVYTLDLNLILPIEMEASYAPYIGLGLGHTNVSSDIENQFGGSDTGFNLVGGAEFETGNLQPFVQAQLTLGDLTRFGITGGLLFAL